MNMLTLLDLKNSRVPNIAGSCATSPQFLDIANKAIRMLMTRGQFEGTTATLRVRIESGCVVWPREVGTVLAVNVCGLPIQAKNNWFQFLPGNGGDIRPDSRCGVRVMQQDNPTPVWRPIRCGHPSYVRLYLERDTDVGRLVTVYGIDQYGNEVRTERVNGGGYLPGVTIALAKPYAQPSIVFREVTRIEKQTTSGPITLYYTETGDGSDMVQAARYAPRDTNPFYRTTSINSFNALGCCRCNAETKAISALVRIQFYPLAEDDDILPIQNIDAIEHMIRSIKFADSFDNGQAKEWEASAIHELNLELNNTQPKQQISVRVPGFGTAKPVRHRIGQMI